MKKTVSELYDEAAWHTSKAESIASDWLEYREGVSIWLDRLAERDDDETLDLILEIGNNGVFSERRYLRIARRHRRIAQRLLKKITGGANYRSTMTDPSAKTSPRATHFNNLINDAINKKETI